MTKIIGKNDGPNGRNEHYRYKGKTFPRKAMVKKVEQQGLGAHIVRVNRRKYVRDNPDNSKKDNVNRNKA